MVLPPQTNPALAAQRLPPQQRAAAAVDLYWLPLGAGDAFVAFNGRVYEAFHALLEQRRQLALYHCALEVHVSEALFVVELTPVPDSDGAARGVACEAPVGSRWLARFRPFRCELRCWRDGVIPDVAAAVASPQRLTEDPVLAHRLLALTASVPTPVWGRDELHTGEMWNSNSVISWLLTRSGVPLAFALPPPGGRAPGWDAGVAVARRQQAAEDSVDGADLAPA